MTRARFITALGTPLDENDQLHTDGLILHLEDQFAAGIDSLLIAGTMGMMPMLPDTTWRDLVTTTTRENQGRAELLVGATDTGTARALERVHFLNAIDDIDGVVIMTPGYVKFPESHYVDYFTALADASRHRIYLYELQPMTGVRLSIDTLCRLAEHPNIAGLKLSANVPDAARLRLRLGNDHPFRLILAEPGLSDMLFRHGYAEHLDGIYAVCPQWATALARAAEAEDWQEAAHWQTRLSQIKELFLTLPFGPLFSGLMQLRGLCGFYAPRPWARPEPSFLDQLRSLPLVQELLAASTHPTCETVAHHVRA